MVIPVHQINYRHGAITLICILTILGTFPNCCLSSSHLVKFSAGGTVLFILDGTFRPTESETLFQ